MWRALREHLEEPAPSRPARPARVDDVVASAAAVLVVAEGLLRRVLAWRPLQIAFGLALVATLRIRRVRPLSAVVVAFGMASSLTAAEWVWSLPELGLHANAVVLLLPYSLLRHGSGREAAIGLATVLATYVVSASTGHMHDAGDAVGALVALLFPAAIGASARFRDRAHRHAVERTQHHERQMLARELHDTVAHHLAAITIQTQAARVSFTKRPDTALAALGAIESEASRALAELRGLVGALRDDVPPKLGPGGGGVEAIAQLVRDAGEHARFHREGDMAALGPAVTLALHRIAREALHNVGRHARGVRNIDVRLIGEGTHVRLVVRDDGHGSGSTFGGGLGLVGMKERALLLGGTFEAGPLAAGGFKVEAVLPCRGVEGARP